ncbi:MAG: hypothetical protein SFU57_01220 [Gemmatimonadales bacterium]|nr:hypothetical protein [Gemmatimonadales bacterium]
MRPVTLLLALALLTAPSTLAAQSRTAEITGTWRVATGADVKEGPKEVIIRADSSASWGKETVRWRVRDNKIWIALGGEWEIYTLRLTAKDITLSGGDLQKPVTLRRVGVATPLAPGVKVPADPDGEE